MRIEWKITLRMQTPRLMDELAATLADAHAARRTVAVCGAGTKRIYGAPPPASAEVSVSTSAMTRVLEYEPADLTISVEAGLKWAELQALLAKNQQMIPLDPPCYDNATVGGVLASNSSGPRRRLYGAARDMVIGVKFSTVNGTVIQSGGMVVKNVAGLDMGKLMIGSFGTLGVMGIVNFKLTPMPPRSATFVERLGSLDEAMSRRDRVLASVLLPAALDVIRDPRGQWLFALQVGATEKVMERYRRELSGAEMLEGDAEAAFWRPVREFVPEWMATHPGGAVVRLSVELRGVGPALRSLPGAAIARAGNGVVYGAFETAEAAAKYAASCGFAAVVEAAPPESAIERWPKPGSDFAVMQEVKRMLDPDNRLNPGRLHGRL